MSEKKESLKAAIKAHAITNRGLSVEKAAMKYRREDRQSAAYQQEMATLAIKRKGARHDARVTLLAYALVRGREYAALEANARLMPHELGYLAGRVAGESGSDRSVVEAWMTFRRPAVAA
jgi:hypothetical protein